MIGLRKIYRVFWVLIILLSIFDVVSTYFYVNIFGLVAEASPTVGFLIRQFGLTGGLLFSFAITLLVIIFLWIVEKKAPKIVHLGTIVVLIAKIIVVGMHIYWITQI